MRKRFKKLAENGSINIKHSIIWLCFQSEIFERFKKEYENICNLPGGDQVWTGPQLKDILYIDEKFPNLVLKFDLSKKNGDKFIIPSIIDKSVKLDACGGKPRPHELHMLFLISKKLA